MLSPDTVTRWNRASLASLILATARRHAKDRSLMNLRQLVERGDRPFATQPQVARYFPAASMEDARQRSGPVDRARRWAGRGDRWRRHRQVAAAASARRPVSREV